MHLFPNPVTLFNLVCYCLLCEGITYVHSYIKKYAWNAGIFNIDGTELPCKREFGNAHDPFVLLVKVLKDYFAE